MLHVSKIIPQGRGLAPVLVKRATSVDLAWDVRQQNRFEATDVQGRRLGVFLPPGTVVRGGDILVAEDGSMIRVVAAPQPVMVIRPGAHGSPLGLVRAAYLLGSGHVATELHPDHLKIAPDHELAQVLRGMHLAVSDTFAAFEPESGSHPGHGHDHHDHDHGSHAHPHHHHEHDTEVHDHEHDGHKHGEHGET